MTNHIFIIDIFFMMLVLYYIRLYDITSKSLYWFVIVYYDTLIRDISLIIDYLTRT